MSYVKTTWQDGDVITTEKLNNIESGIESSLSNELLALYKTMAGKDWPYDPNPTDAEVIDKIAADATGGGGGDGLWEAGTGSGAIKAKTAAAASGNASHAEGTSTNATGDNSHAEGVGNTASGPGSHAEGCGGVIASGAGCHAEGSSTRASVASSHAEGSDTVASDFAAHAEGAGTIAASSSQHVQGSYNIEDSNNIYAHIVGNGTRVSRSNCHTLDWNGNAWFAGSLSLGNVTLTSAQLQSLLNMLNT